MYKEKQQAVDEYFGKDSENISLLPNLWQGKEYMGQQTYETGKGNEVSQAFKDKYGEGIKPKDLPFEEKILSPFDINPIFKFIYNTLPGGKGATMSHDAEYKDESNAKVLRSSIAPSFMSTWYSTIYGKYQGKIRDSFSKKENDNE